jgi:hypothetical protein
MSFDFGLSFRNTLSYVTDPSYVAVLFELFPHTYTNGQGNTLSAGRNAASGGFSDFYVIDATTSVRELSSGSWIHDGPATGYRPRTHPFEYVSPIISEVYSDDSESFLEHSSW